MSVAIKPGSVIEAGTPAPLFRAPISGVNVYRTDYAVSGDGQRFLDDAVDGSDKDESIALMVNWLAALKHEF
jgi:hypothetical protein